jgi:hypothetical protein
LLPAHWFYKLQFHHVPSQQVSLWP